MKVMNDYFSNRATVRHYKDKEISDAMLTSIIERAMWAPTCGNMQLYSVIATRDKERKKELAAMHYNQPAATEANVILTICADFNRWTRWCSLRGAEPGYNNFHSFIMAMTDAVIFAQQIVTIAEMEGLGSCYLGTVNYNAAEISDLLELPEMVIPVAALSIGYPAETPSKSERLPVKAVLHTEVYRKDNDNDMLGLFKDKEEFPANVEFVQQNGKPSLAHIFTDIRYPRDVNEKVSETFHQLLKDNGFI